MLQTTIQVEVSPGELIDKITILRIKADRIADAAKLANVTRELELLEQALAQAIDTTPELQGLADELRGVNEQLWEIEDEIRICERDQDFGPRFVQLARDVYKTNDKRSAVKRRINKTLGTELVEEKHYVDYSGPDND